MNGALESPFPTRSDVQPPLVLEWKIFVCVFGRVSNKKNEFENLGSSARAMEETKSTV